MSRDESFLSPTYVVMGMRRQLSDAHLFEETDLSYACARCWKHRRHGDHVTRDEDKAEVKRWRDRYVADL